MSDIDLVDRAEARAREEAPVREPARNVSPAHPKPVKPLSPAGIRIAVHNDLDGMERDWRAFEKDAACTVFQTYGWLSKWQRNVGKPARILPIIVTGRNAAGALLFIFPFAIETRGLLRCITWLGRELCDYNAPIVTPDFLHDMGTAGFAALWRTIVARIRETSRTRFDLIDLDKMPEHLGGQLNPFSGLDVLVHPCGAHVSTLGEDWEKYYASKRSSASRKKERKKLRQLGEHGEVRFVSASAHEDRVEIMKVLIGQKSHWFARMGVKDIFARPGTRDFFMDVAADPAMQDIVHISRLSVGETAAATSVGLRFRDCYYLVLSSYLDAEISKLGPGRAHLHELLRYAIAKHFRWFDFTVGDEPYKRDWSDKVVKLYDYIEPVTLRGRLAALTLLGYRTLKRFIKSTPILWRAYGSLRLLKGRWCGGARGASESEQGAE